MPIRARVGIAVDLLKKRAHGGDVLSRVRDDTYRGIFLYAQNLKRVSTGQAAQRVSKYSFNEAIFVI
jgi:hypothetical protein